MKVLTLAELNSLTSYIESLKVTSAHQELVVGMNVWVIQKTKRTSGVIKKINKTRCLVDMSGSQYNVPMSMIEPL
jgi:FKBP-type peptidyl-prolyl cis-trans isomerase 2